jgi:hypothetical protein
VVVIAKYHPSSGAVGAVAVEKMEKSAQHCRLQQNISSLYTLLKTCSFHIYFSAA